MGKRERNTMKLAFALFTIFCGVALGQDGTDAAGTDVAGTDSAGTDSAGTDADGSDAAGTDDTNAAGSDGSVGVVEITMAEVNDCSSTDSSQKFEASGLSCHPERILLEVPYCAFI